ncbi:hypothetical protein [Lactobacillus gasseri]|uniref:hypothetical protein n=1 Tax=Lactobacillus gasseri TaxID=1596 RepID=UPI00038A29BB|nr:hypothetical protein [Lactobacillus gasseri]MCZ3541772.1 hypothetical protein [Lactobacillus gasseri]MCZ3589397.1 hypothetical protein [Lactobacillus gasseri]UJD19682.1 hypothetical protein M497_03780 [Lactobacillus gasseri 2016]
MLKTNKSIAISGQSMVDNKQVATFNANIYEANASGGSDNINMIITDRDAYDKNKNAVRKDLQDFQTKVWSAQDEVMASADKKASEG